MLTRADKILMVIILILSIFGLLTVAMLSSKGEKVIVESGGELLGEIPLKDKDVLTEVKGPLGTTIVEVKDGKVRVKDSPCPNKICVRMGWILRRDQMIVCVPNKVVVRVEGTGGEARSYDVVTR